MRVLLPLLCLCWSQALETEDPNDLRIRLTAERGGPPLGASFVPIPVINIPQFAPRPNFVRPLKGRPPPPPPIFSGRPTRPPRPQTSRPLRPPVAPPPLPMPLPTNNSVPQITIIMQPNFPPLPPNIAVGQPPSNQSPALDLLPVTAAPVATTTPRDKDFAPAIYQRFQQNDDLSYYFDFQAENTITRREQGFFKDAGSDQPIFVQSGSFSYTSPEGYPFRVDYVADERGFRTFPSLP